MRVIFLRTAQRRYAIEARRPTYPDVGMDPAPGYDPLLPHDVLHMVVEAELGLTRGVFGQLAAGGDAGTFGHDLSPPGDSRERSRRQRRTKARGSKLLREGREQSAQSERATYICWYEWLARSEIPARRRLAETMVHQAREVRDMCPSSEAAALTDEFIQRVSGKLDEISRLWAELDVGEGIEVSWPMLRVARATDSS
ncbi:MAG: hypothetical protein HKM89_04310 [Gemmatimonadales bacterium]|nr:hypothetical protein [Gemmatimonadales bacterium]